MKVSKIKRKVAAKVAKGKEKVQVKCGKAAKAVAVLAVLLAFCGCSTTGEQPARSQTQNNEIHDCTFIVAGKAIVNPKGSTNELVKAEGEVLPSVEWFTQTQANEGSETISPTASPTNTTDIKPDVDVNTTGGRTAGVLETAITAGASALMNATSSSGSASAASGTCTDGSCTPNGACTDGSCSPGGACTDGSCTLSTDKK